MRTLLRLTFSLICGCASECLDEKKLVDMTYAFAKKPITGRRQSPFNWKRSPKAEHRKAIGIRLTTIAARSMSEPT